MIALPYVPYGAELSGVPHVFVDGLRTADTVLELSHWPGNRTPLPFKADVSSQSVLALLAEGDDTHLAGAEAVTCDHYDVDGVLSVWCLVAPDEALARRELVEQVAVTGDFDTYTSAAAARACLAMEAAERLVARQVAEAQPTSTDAATAMLFRAVLARLPAILEQPSIVDGWQAEYAKVEASLRKLDDGAWLDESDALDLAIVAPDADLHTYAVFARTGCLHVAGSDGGRHWLRQRYESFVELQSRPTAPRVRGDILAAELNERETAGTWRCETPDTATPALQLYAPTGTPAPSSLSWDVFLATVTDFFERAATDPALRWERHADWYLTSAVAPPSGAPG